MKSIWIEQGDAIDYPRFRSMGLTHIYVDIRREYNPVARVAEVRNNGFTAGVYWGHWPSLEPQASGGERHAKFISDEIADFEQTWRKAKDSVQCEFQIDQEDKYSDWMEIWLRTWRKPKVQGGAGRPLKVTSWTLESWQGGRYTWMEKSLVDLINADVNIKIIPQLYNGNLSETYDSHAVANNLRWMIHPDGQEGGIREDRIEFFYNVLKEVPRGWEGYLFTNRGL